MSFSLTTINAERTKQSGEEVSLTVRALSSDDYIQLDRVWTVDKLPVSKESISSTEDIRDWPHLWGISIPKLDKEVSILIGNDVPEAHLVFEERRGRHKQPCAAQTLLGWTLIGPVGGTSNPKANVNFLSRSQETLSVQIERIYNAEFRESSASSKQMMSIEDESQWPTQPTQLPEIDEDDQNVKRLKKARMQGFDSLLHRYSSWYGLKKALDWLSRFKHYLLYRTGKIAKGDVKRGELTVQEVQNAEVGIIKYLQRLYFPRELTTLMGEAQQCKNISRTSGKRLRDGSYDSPLRKLNPVIVDGLIRVGGRLNNAEDISYAMKHPIVLPSKHHVTDLIIRHYHQIGHVGASQVLAAIRRTFWILRGGSAVRRVVTKCIKCRRWNAMPESQIMAPLPAVRITPGDAPFTAVGIDYFGPISVKLKRSRVKRYGCIFTCLTMRAVHIEVSQDFPTDSFLLAFSRFVSRPGAPIEVYSDNGSNFKGAECEVKRALEMWNQPRITESLRKRSIQWHFNPPQASHQGGVWERMIHSARKILCVLLGNRIVNDETLLTVMAEVEKILNDLPLTRLSEDPKDLEPLTPNHLLLSHRNLCVAPGDFSTASADRYTRCWRQAQYLSNIFWRRWVDGYLLSLQERQKWIRPRRYVAVGDLVLKADEHSPRGQWPMGVVDEVTLDRYGVVRRATVRTTRAILKRDIRKLCLLEAAGT